VVERSRTEPEGDHGHLQSELYAYRFGGAVAGAVAGALLYNKEAGWGWGLTFAQVIAVAGLLPLLFLLPLLLPLREMPLAHGHHRRPHRHAKIVSGGEEEEEEKKAGLSEVVVEIGSGRTEGVGVGEEEEGEVGYMSVSAQVEQIWRIIQLPIVYMPMAFVYVYNLLQSA
jgi:MFS family permease